MKGKLFASFATFSVLIACSSGGGGSGAVVSPDPSLQITSNNAMQVANLAYQTAVESQQLGDSGGLFFIGSAQGDSAKIKSAFATSAKVGSGNVVSQVPIPAETTPCAVSGSMTISGDIADPVTPTLSAGDYFEVQYDSCDDGFGQVTNGKIRTDIDAFDGDFLTERFSMTMTITLTNLQVSTFNDQSTIPTDVLTSNGDATVSVDTRNSPFVSTSVSGNSLVVDTNGSSESLTNYASAFTVDGSLFPSPYTLTASGTLDSTQLAGVIRYSTPLIFDGLGSDYPSSGEFLVEGLGSSLRLIADNNVDVRIQIDLGADGTIDETIVTTWAELAAS